MLFSNLRLYLKVERHRTVKELDFVISYIQESSNFVNVDQNNLGEEELHITLKYPVLWIRISQWVCCVSLTTKEFVLHIQQNNAQEEGLQKTEAVTENVTTVAKDPRYARYLKMVQVVSRFSCHSLARMLIFGGMYHMAVK